MIISKKPPYTGTTADPARTRAAIDKLLQDYGISKYAWTQDFEHQQVQLIFEVETEIGGQKKRLNIKVAPPTFAKKHLNYNAMTGRHDKVLAPNWAQSFLPPALLLAQGQARGRGLGAHGGRTGVLG